MTCVIRWYIYGCITNYWQLCVKCNFKFKPKHRKQINRKIAHLCDITINIKHFNRWNHRIVKNRSRSNYFENFVFFFHHVMKNSSERVTITFPFGMKSAFCFRAQIFTLSAIVNVIIKKNNNADIRVSMIIY